MFQRKKWWEVVDKDNPIETKLFEILSRHGKYKWRSTVTVAKALGIDNPEELQNLLAVFVKNRIILCHKTEKGMYLGYWEVVGNETEACHCNEHCFGNEEDEFDPNSI